MKPPEFLGQAVSWSPDGKTVAADFMGADGESTVALINVATGGKEFALWNAFQHGRRDPLASRWKRVGHTAQEKAAEPTKIWCLAYPSGNARLVTNDLDFYSRLSLALTSDGSSLISVQSQSTSNVYVSPRDDLRTTPDVLSHMGKNDGIWGLSWDRNGRLYSVSQEENKSETWMLDPGAEAPKLVMEESVLDTLNVTPNGDALVFISKRSGTWGIWRADSDGSHLTQLSTGTDIPEQGISVTPDGNWVLYTNTGLDNIYRTPTQRRSIRDIRQKPSPLRSADLA